MGADIQAVTNTYNYLLIAALSHTFQSQQLLFSHNVQKVEWDRAFSKNNPIGGLPKRVAFCKCCGQVQLQQESSPCVCAHVPRLGCKVYMCPIHAAEFTRFLYGLPPTRMTGSLSQSVYNPWVA